jgi:hypothetical protein
MDASSLFVAMVLVIAGSAPVAANVLFVTSAGDDEVSVRRTDHPSDTPNDQEWRS